MKALSPVTAENHLLCSLKDFWMATHSQIIIAAPDGDILPISGEAEVLGMREGVCQPIHTLEHTVAIIILLLLDFFHEELLIVKVRKEIVCTWG